MNFILDQEVKVKQLKEYMGVIGSDFMQLSLEVIVKIKEEIRMGENRVKNIDKITSSREIPSVDEPEPQLLPNFSPIDVNLRDKKGTDPSIKPHSLDSFKMKEVDNLTIHTPPSPHMVPFHVKDMMNNLNITMEEYIRLEEEKAPRHGKVYNWESGNYGKIWDDEDVHDLRSFKTEFPAIVFNDKLSSEKHSLVNLW
nr:hypothetical protein [Tanacetum cinerariifolium]